MRGSFSELVGKTVARVESEKYKIVFTFEDGTEAHMHHGGSRFPYIEEVDDGS